MDWTQWGKGEERAPSSAGCKILEASLRGRLRASVNVSWHNGAGSGLQNLLVISLLFGSAYVLFFLAIIPKEMEGASEFTPILGFSKDFFGFVTLELYGCYMVF